MWDPWTELERRGHVKLIWRPLPVETGGAAIVQDHDWTLIYIDPRLSGHERSAALAHELVHDERGVLRVADLPPHVRSWFTVREERHVDDQVAHRMVPLDVLQDLVVAADGFGHCTTADEVAEEFDVPHDVAHRALQLLQERVRRAA